MGDPNDPKKQRAGGDDDGEYQPEEETKKQLLAALAAAKSAAPTPATGTPVMDVEPSGPKQPTGGQDFAPQPSFTPSNLRKAAYAFEMSSARLLARRRKRFAIFGAAGAFIVLQIVAAVVIVTMKRTPEKDATKPEGNNPIALYSKAKMLVSEGKHLEAQETLDRLQMATKDEEMLNLASTLQRKLRAETQLDQARRLIQASQWAAARLHLEQTLSFVPDHAVALALLDQAKRKLDTNATPTKIATPTPTPTPDDDPLEPKTKKGRKGAKPPRGKPDKGGTKVAVVTPTPTPAPASAQLFISSKPVATLYIDGAVQGFTPQSGLKVAAGHHVISLKGDGLAMYSTHVTLAPGEKKVMEIKLKQLGEPEPEVVKVEPKKVEPKKVEPQIVEPQIVAKTSVVIPTLRLPVRVNVPIYKSGQRSKALAAVCHAIEQSVSRAIGKSAAGATAAFQSLIYDEQKSSADASAMIYPRVMGYLIAQAVANDKPGIGGALVSFHKSGRLASMATANWRP